MSSQEAANEQNPQPDASEDDLLKDRAIIQAFGSILGDSLTKIASTTQSQTVQGTALAAIVASLPGLSEIDHTKLGVVVGVLSRGLPNEAAFRQQVTLVAAKLLTIAHEAAKLQLPSPEASV